jgi:hypothetical protein
MLLPDVPELPLLDEVSDQRPVYDTTRWTRSPTDVQYARPLPALVKPAPVRKKGEQ